MKSVYSFSQISASEFEAMASSLSPVKIPIEQTPLWGEFDDSLPKRTFLGSFRYDDGTRMIALASATLYQQKGRDWIWIKHGPLFAHEPNTEIIKKMCSTFKQQFARVQETRPVFIRLSLPSSVSDVKTPFEHTMYDETVIIDLTRSEEEILANMSQGGRRSLRKAQKEELIVNEYSGETASDIFTNHCYPILKETGQRDGFGIHPVGLYTNMLERLPENATLYTISHQKQVVAWAITTEYAKNVLYYYGGSNALARDLHAPYLLHWEIMKKMKARSNTTYDFMGISGSNYPELASVTTFKLKFSKEITKVRPAYDLPLKPAKYRLLSLAIKTKRKLR